MGSEGDRRLVTKAFEQLGQGLLSENWTGADAVLPLLERMREEGAVIVVKLDGERRPPEDTGPYTVIVSGAKLGGEFFRADCASLDDGLARLIAWYGTRYWGL